MLLHLKIYLSSSVIGKLSLSTEINLCTTHLLSKKNYTRLNQHRTLLSLTVGPSSTFSILHQIQGKIKKKELILLQSFYTSLNLNFSVQLIADNIQGLH